MPKRTTASKPTGLAQDKKGLFLHYLQLTAPDLPLPDATEYEFARPQRKWLADFVYWGGAADQPHIPGLLIEIDGGQWCFAGGRHARDDDRDKGNRAAALGWLTMHISPQQLTNYPEAVLADVRAALKRIGRAP